MSKWLFLIPLTATLILRAAEPTSIESADEVHMDQENGFTVPTATTSSASLALISKSPRTGNIQFLNPLARNGQDKWLRIGLLWAGLALDLTSTKKALGTNPNVHEGNLLLRDSNGNFRTGLYLGAMLPLNSVLTYGNLRYPHRRSIRAVTYVASTIKIGFAISNFRLAR